MEKLQNGKFYRTRDGRECFINSVHHELYYGAIINEITVESCSWDMSGNIVGKYNYSCSIDPDSIHPEVTNQTFEIYIPKEDIAKAFQFCDLGDFSSAKIYIYPHKSDIDKLTKFKRILK